jgi:Transposase IS66 family.
MPEFKDLPDDFRCPYRDGCPYLEGLSTSWVFHRYQRVGGTESRYEYQLEELYKELDAERRGRKELELQNRQLQAQLQALHRRQFKGRTAPSTPPACPSTQRKKRGAPVGHPPWGRPKPKQIDLCLEIPAPQCCPECQSTNLQPVPGVSEHVQEDIVLQPRVVTTCFVHQQAHCPHCERDVLLPGPGELPGSYIGPAAKATAIYLRYELNVSDRKISRFFADFFGLKFVPASAYGFERQAVRRGQPLYLDLLEKVRSLAVAHADETSWRNDGRPYWVWYAGNKDLAAFLLDQHRTAQAAQKLLGQKFGGVLVADAFGSYNGVEPKDRQSCLSHIKTKAKEIEQELALLTKDAADPEAQRFCQDIQGWVHEACQAHHTLTARRWCATSAKAQERKLKKRLRKLCRQPLQHPKAEKFRQRLLGPEQKLLFTCFRRPGVPPTNNQAEQSLRPVVIMRRVIQGTRSEKGLQNHSVLRSLFETAKRQGKKPQTFFLDLFTKNTAQAQAALYRQPLSSRPRPALRC